MQGERAGSSLKLLPVHLYVLLHLKKAGVDYAKMMAKVSGLPLDLINDAIRDLMEAGFIERDPGSAIKRSKARFKKAFEVPKHHTYYRLSRKGELFLRSFDPREYFNSLLPNGWEVVRALAERRNVNELDLDMETVEELKVYRFITEKGRKTEFFRVLSNSLSFQ
ncbi:DUF2250 domain-containing protein [Pyrococcus kukulkanii]|uniref:DUF2250 domain-containing protein n=1 Tax=Pyrococcus kukulkanii TaxID=1609559 RepID=A0A127B8P0_9EURY|nr:DUF2250 domain-containing protein [Pyrococcus kukulkanii]AMM53742.1 hypothetical protein TQ32_04040 [Pyrococcus kukulkanii]